MFMYFSHSGVHTPIQSPQEFIDMYPADMDEGRKGYLAMVSQVSATIDWLIVWLIDLLDYYGSICTTNIGFIVQVGYSPEMCLESTVLLQPHYVLFTFICILHYFIILFCRWMPLSPLWRLPLRPRECGRTRGSSSSLMWVRYALKQNIFTRWKPFT